jgi:ADP-ribose pyrophosphatase YjhB (NUDIX family)
MSRSLAEELYQIADELRGIASIALSFSKNSYEIERSKRVMELSARLVGVIEKRPAEEILPRFLDNLYHWSAISGVEAVVVREGKILLIQREDDGLWALPGGLSEIGETLAQSAQRELHEEAGVHGRVTQLLGIFDSRLWGTPSPVQLYSVIFRIESDAAPVAGPETLAAQFFAEQELPPLSPGHDLRVPFVLKQMRGEAPVPYFDPIEESEDAH